MGSSVKNLDLLKQKERSVDKTVAILDLIAENHPGSFEMLIEKYGNLVWSIGKKFLGNQSDLEDAVQEVMIAIWKSADKFDANKASEITFRFNDRQKKIYRLLEEDH